MILVRTEMQCKWGRVQEVLDRTQASFERLQGQDTPVKRTRILTDLSGAYDRVIIETEVESIDAFLAFLQATFESPEFKAMQEAMPADQPYASGTRSYYTIEATYE